MHSSFVDTLAPETRLLIYCARTGVHPELKDKIRELAKGPLNWGGVFLGAEQHSVVPLVDRQLRALAMDLVPTLEMQRWDTAIRANALCCLRLIAALVEILREFHSAGIVAAPYKGPVLAVQAYRDVARRQFADLDILLQHKDAGKAHEIMRQLAYEDTLPELPPPLGSLAVPGEYKYRGEIRAAVVELHTERTFRHFPVAPDLGELCRRGAVVNLSGHDVRTLSLEDTLVAICVHGSKDLWARMLWIADVSELIQSHLDLDWAEVIHRAELLRAERMLYVGLILAQRLFDTPLPADVATILKKDDVAEAIAIELERNLLRGGSTAAIAMNRYQIRRRLVPGFLAGWRYALRLTMAPAEEDWKTIRLPRPLAPFYFVLRPFRLLRKYTRPDEAA